MSNWVTRLRTVAGLATLATVAGAVVAAPAEARDECDYRDGVFCVYRLSTYSGGTAWWTSGDFNANYSGDYFDNGYSLNDRVSSVQNDTIYPVVLYQHSYYQGASRCVKARSKRSFGGTWFDNRATSHVSGAGTYCS